MNHKEIVIAFKDEVEKEALIVSLCEAGYDGFAEEEQILKAYIEEENFDIDELNKLSKQNGFSYKLNHIAEQNWNQLWESNYEQIGRAHV